MTDLNRLKRLALCHFQDCEPSDIEHALYGEDTFTVYGAGEFLVLTEDEADAKVGEEIKRSAWAFNPSFIRQHSKLPIEAEEMIKGFLEAKCEDANNTILALITDLDEFIRDAVAGDGRGHFLASEDGTEHQEKVAGQTFYIYQLNQ